MSKKYSISELLTFCKTVVSVKEIQEEQPSVLAEADDTYTPTFNASFSAICAGCASLRGISEKPIGQSYDEWLVLARALSRCSDGESLFHKLSRQDPRYNSHETQSKFEEAKNRMSPPRCQYIENSLVRSECKECAVRGTINSPMSFGRAAPETAKLQSEWVIEAETQRFHSLVTREVRTEPAFRTRYNHLIKKGSISQTLIQDQRTGKVDRATYKPGCSDLILEADGVRFLNTWRSGGVEPREGNWEVLKSHFDLLFSDSATQSHFLNYLACVVQKPGVKLSHAILVSGKQGIGKSVLSALITHLIGKHNIKELGPDQADNRFRAGWGDCQVLFMEELMMGERLEFYNNLKPWITQETCTAEEKHIPMRNVSTPRAFLMFSNHRNAALLPPDDRRFFVVNSAMERQEFAYYERLWRAVEEEAAAFKHFLLQREISDFSPSMPAPMTIAKAELVEDSRPPLEQELRDMVEAREHPFHSDIVHLDKVIHALKFKGNNNVRRNSVLSAMNSCNFHRLGQIPLHDGTRPRLWSVRNHDKWKNSGVDDIQTEYLKTPGSGYL
ncbi:DUF5906 domain-containing protein [Hyphococcus sp. DH-69]|uniref:DUF5906 domain-containing protein n=1 Tax=Hyphococcus formosus TaxID=3143534 RepID=UPI00398AED1A